MSAERQLDFEAAPIKDASALGKYVASLPVDSPLAKMSLEGRNRFLASVVFRDAGLGGYSYADLRRELSAIEVYRTLALFGAQRSARNIPGLRRESIADNLVPLPLALPVDDYKNYACASRATCRPDFDAICMSGC